MKQKGLIQAAAIAGYCAIASAFMSNVEKFFGKTPDPFGPAAFLMMLSVSVLTCGLLVFYQPYKLFFDNKKKQAVDLVVYTTGWMFLFFVIFVVLAIVLK